MGLEMMRQVVHSEAAAAAACEDAWLGAQRMHC